MMRYGEGAVLGVYDEIGQKFKLCIEFIYLTISASYVTLFTKEETVNVVIPHIKIYS